MNLRKIAAPYYLFVLLLHCIFLGLEWTMASKFTKPLLMPLLIIYLYKALKSSFPELAKTDHNGNMLSVRPINKSIIVLAFVASWAGDLFLMFEGLGLFIAGMVSFMTAHISYCYLFNQIQPFKRKKCIVSFFTGRICSSFGHRCDEYYQTQSGRFINSRIHLYVCDYDNGGVCFYDHGGKRH